MRFLLLLAAIVLLAVVVARITVAAPWEPCTVSTAADVAGACIPSTLSDGDIIQTTKWILDPVPPAPMTVTFEEPTGRILFSPSTINVAAGDVAFESQLTVKYLVTDTRRNHRLAVWVKLGGAGATGAGYADGRLQWMHNVTVTPQVFCELLPNVEVFYPGTTSTEWNLTCTRATDSTVTLNLPNLTSSGITWTPAGGVVLNPGDTWGAFTATAALGTLGSFALTTTFSGENATRYAKPPTRDLRVMPRGRVTAPPKFTAVAYRETDPLHVDLTIVPVRPVNVTISVWRYAADNTTVIDALALDEVELHPRRVIMFNSGTEHSAAAANRGNFTLIGKRYGDYWLTFALDGSESANFEDPATSVAPVNFTIASPEDGFAFTKRSGNGYLSNFRSCRVGVGRKSFYYAGQEPVDEAVCNQLPKPNLTEGEDVNCSQWISAERCQAVAQEKGHPCAWLRDPSPSRCVEVPDMRNITEQIAFGLAATVFLDTNGSVWTVGSPKYGQLGRGFLYQEQQENVLGEVELPEKIKSIAMGANHVLALGRTGTLYGWGSNTVGQLGTGEAELTYFTPQAINFPRYENVTCISAGPQHSAVVTLGGRFYRWGSNARGQLGLDPNNTHSGGFAKLDVPTVIPKSVFNGDSLIALQCGEMHTSVATRFAVYTFGGNIYGQLGRDDRYYYSNKANSLADSQVLTTEEATQSQVISNWKPNAPMNLYVRLPPVVTPLQANNYTPAYAPYALATDPGYQGVRRGSFANEGGNC